MKEVEVRVPFGHGELVVTPASARLEFACGSFVSGYQPSDSDHFRAADMARKIRIERGWKKDPSRLQEVKYQVVRHLRYWFFID